MQDTERRALSEMLKLAMTENDLASFAWGMNEFGKHPDENGANATALSKLMTWRRGSSNHKELDQRKKIKQELTHGESWRFPDHAITWAEFALYGKGRGEFFKILCEKRVIANYDMRDQQVLFGEAVAFGREDLALAMLSGSESSALLTYVKSANGDVENMVAVECGSLGLATEMRMPRLCAELASRQARLCVESGESQGLARARMEQARAVARAATAHDGVPDPKAMRLSAETIWDIMVHGADEKATLLRDQVGSMRLCAFAIRTAMLAGLRGMAMHEAKELAWSEARLGAGLDAAAMEELGDFKAALVDAAKRIRDLEAKVAMMAAPRRALMDEAGNDERPRPIGPKS